MDSTHQDRVPSRDNRRRLTPRVERVEVDFNDFTTALIYFKDDMDTARNRKPIGEFRVTTDIGVGWYVRYREAANTFNWSWVNKRVLRLTNPLTPEQMPGQTGKLIYISGNIRGARRFHLGRGVICRRVDGVLFDRPVVTVTSFNEDFLTLALKWSDGVDFQGGTGDIIVQSGDGTEYWFNDGQPFLVEDGTTHNFYMLGPFPGVIINPMFYEVPADSFFTLISGKGNLIQSGEWSQ